MRSVLYLKDWMEYNAHASSNILNNQIAPQENDAYYHYGSEYPLDVS